MLLEVHTEAALGLRRLISSGFFGFGGLGLRVKGLRLVDIKVLRVGG